MLKGRLRNFGAVLFTVALSATLASSAAAQAKPGPGRLSGVVRDGSGTPQMGATVEVVQEVSGRSAARGFLTDTQGSFRGDKLLPGLYTVRVTLAGYLPTLEQHVRINANLTTIVRIELESTFAALDQLRRPPVNTTTEADDWKWVLRSASSMRPALEWVDPQTLAAARSTSDARVPGSPRARIEFSDGALRSASASNITSAPATAFAYDQSLGGTSQLLLAAQMSYDQEAPSGGLATVWLPTGSIETGPHTALVLREAKLGPAGPTFRGIRINQGGTFSITDRASLKYGAEYVLVGIGAAASSIRPRAQLGLHLSDDWHAALIFASLPAGNGALDGGQGDKINALAAAVNELNAFPTLLWRNGHPVLQNGYHEEIQAERKLGARGKLQVAGFHDDNRHVAVYGRGADSLPSADYFQDYFSDNFAYDGGSSNAWGARAALQQSLGDNFELTAVYAFSGALTPSALDGMLREVLKSAARQSVAGNLTAKLPKVGTKVDAGYKWVGGRTVSRVDAYGESLFQTDPYLHLGFRQPLPKFVLGRWEAVAECDNLLAQGYVPVGSRDGQVILVPSFRTFRGGLNVQF